MSSSWFNPGTEKRHSPIAGRGLFAREAIRAGEIVAVKGGAVMDTTTFRPIQATVTPAEIQIEDDLYVAPLTADEVEANILCLNHSCNPNVGVRGQITFVAMQDISAGSELTIDYAMIDGDPDERMECSCGAATCRRTITGSDWRLPELQQRYSGYFSRYLEERFERYSRDTVRSREPCPSLTNARSATGRRSDVEGLDIRPLRVSDPVLLAAAFAAAGWLKPSAQFDRYFAEQEAGHRHVFVACLNDEFAGYTTLNWQPRYQPFRTASIPEIQDLNVLPSFRRRGIGSALLDAAEAAAASRAKVAGIAVGLSSHYGAAQRLYVRRGYVPDGRGAVYRLRTVKHGDALVADDDLVVCFTRQLTAAFHTGRE